MPKRDPTTFDGPYCNIARHEYYQGLCDMLHIDPSTGFSLPETDRHHGTRLRATPLCY